MSSRIRQILGLGQILLAILVIIALMVALAVPRTALVLSSRHWDNTFQAWRGIINPYFEEENACKSNITAYRESWNQDLSQGYDITNCILEQFPEFRKAEMAASAVILGLLPGLLQLLGPTYADTALLGYRRPVLGFLLAAGSPTVRPMHATDHEALVEQWEKRTKHSWNWKEEATHAFTTPIILVLEYLLAVAAMANNAHITYQLGVWATCSFAPTLTTLPAIWYISAVLIHLVGWLTMRLRMELTVKGEDDPIVNEGTPLAWGKELDVSIKKEGAFFLALVSILYAGCIFQVLYGTTILSSLLFISASDSALLALRYIASTLACRMILILELIGGRQAATTVNGRPRELSEKDKAEADEVNGRGAQGQDPKTDPNITLTPVV